MLYHQWPCMEEHARPQCHAWRSMRASSAMRTHAGSGNRYPGRSHTLAGRNAFTHPADPRALWSITRAPSASWAGHALPPFLLPPPHTPPSPQGNIAAGTSAPSASPALPSSTAGAGAAALPTTAAAAASQAGGPSTSSRAVAAATVRNGVQAAVAPLNKRFKDVQVGLGRDLGGDLEGDLEGKQLSAP